MAKYREPPRPWETLATGETRVAGTRRHRMVQYAQSPQGIARMMKRAFLSASLLLLCLPVNGDQVSPEQLDALRERISKLERALSEDLQSRDELQSELRRTEVRISDLASEARELLARRERAREQLEALEAEREKLVDEQATQIDWLTRTVRASFMSGREPLVKLLLNQEEPDQLARMLRYQEYFQKARSERLESIREDLEHLRRVSLEIRDAREELARRHNAVAERQRQLEQAGREREQALARVTRRLDDREERLRQMRENEARLQQLLEEMDEALADIPDDPTGKAFSEMAGELPWPVSGQRKVEFGSRREGSVRWNGVLLQADTGTPVRVVHSGRVVFADWLRGYGLMIIVDHGERFFTMYGHNRSLLRDVGDWVQTGDVLALAGNSGGMDSSGVYFEIRRDGQPQDPDGWCSRHATMPSLAGY